MSRLFKKTAAMVLALSMLFGSFGTTALADVRTGEGTPEVVHDVTEIKYDNAVTYNDTVVLIENGNWASGGDRWNYNPDDQISNVSLDTNLVFVDASGRKKVIKNNKDGETLFDAVYPMVSEGLTTEISKTVKVIKDGKMSFIKSDGSYFANNLAFYSDAYVLNDSIWMVSDDGKNYRIVNMNGETISEGFENQKTNYGGTLGFGEIGDYFVIYTKGKVDIVDATGKIVYTFNYDDYLSLDHDEERIYFRTSSKFVAVKYDGTVVYSFTEKLKSASAYPEEGYVVLSLESEEDSNAVYYAIADIKTGEIILTENRYIMLDGDVVYAYNEETRRYELKNFDGEVYITDMDGMYVELAKKMGFDFSTASRMSMSMDRVIVSLQDGKNPEILKTAILRKEDKYDIEKAIIVDGCNHYDYYAAQAELLVCANTLDSFVARTQMDYIYDLDGNCVFDRSKVNDDFMYSVYAAVYKESGEPNNSELSLVPGIACVLRVMDENNKETFRILKKDGTLSKQYGFVDTHTKGSYICVGYIENDQNQVAMVDFSLNEKFKKPGYSGKIINAKNDIVVMSARSAFLYDENGNMLYGKENVQVDVGQIDTEGGYRANSWDSTSYYVYNNFALENGLCVVAEITEDGSYKYGVIKIGGTIVAQEDGLHYDEEDGVWYYYVDGEIATEYTGFVEHEGLQYYVEKGVCNPEYSGLVEYNDTFYYVVAGVLNESYTGFVEYKGEMYYIIKGELGKTYTGFVEFDNKLLYVINGVFDRTFSGLVEYNDTLYYVVGGMFNDAYTGLVEYNGAMYYMVKGILDKTYTGFVEHDNTLYYIVEGVFAKTYTSLLEYNGAWYYVENGVFNKTYTGLVAYNDAWFYVENGILNWGYTGLTEYYGAWYYVQNGVLNWGYTGLTEYYGAWYYVENGVLNWNYTGLVLYGENWFYVENGVLNWGYTGLTLYGENWFYVENGVLNWYYTGLTEYYGGWYYVENGVLNWYYTGLVQYYGNWYYVENGVLNWYYTGLTCYYGNWYYVAGGVLDWGYTGLVEYYGTYYYVGNGVLDWSFNGVVEYNGYNWKVVNGIVVGLA